MGPVRILIVLTSRHRLAGQDAPVGFWFDDFVAAWDVFSAAGADIVLASPDGGAPPTDPASDCHPDSPATQSFKADRNAREALNDTLSLDQIDPSDFDGIFYPGGFGLLEDLVEDGRSIALIEALEAAHKPMGFVAQGPAVLLRAQSSPGVPLVAGRRLTAIPQDEASALKPGLTVPAIPEALQERGALLSLGAAGLSHVVQDRDLVTGQNSASAAETARALLAAITGRLHT